VGATVGAATGEIPWEVEAVGLATGLAVRSQGLTIWDPIPGCVAADLEGGGSA
jgi:hypothetical protein